MEARAHQRDCRKAAILATACLAMALAFLSCGGGSVELVFTSTAGFSLSSTVISFVSQGVGSTSPPLSATLTNNGSATLTLSSVQVTGPNAGDFTLTNNCASSLAASAQCTLAFTFAPSAAGARSASVVFTDNAAGSPQSLNLVGTGTAPVVGLSATTLTFGSQTVGASSPAQTVTLSNTGNAGLSIAGLAVTGTNAGDFAQTNTCANPVAAGGNCTISVTFTPTASGSRTASVSISDNASGSPQMVALSGTGSTPMGAASLSPTTLSFGTQPVATTSAAQTLTLNNGGSVPLSISGLTITGTNAGDFARIADTCGSSLAGGGNCTIGVTFTPSATGQRTATLTISDNASGSSQTAICTGMGSPDVILSWGASPSSGVVGYNVFRGTSSGGESSTPLNSTPINGTSFVDTKVTAGMTYYYVVTSVGSNGVQSAPSNETEAVMPTS